MKDPGLYNRIQTGVATVALQRDIEWGEGGRGRYYIHIPPTYCTAAVQPRRCDVRQAAFYVLAAAAAQRGRSIQRKAQEIRGLNPEGKQFEHHERGTSAVALIK